MNVARKAYSPLHNRLHQLRPGSSTNWNSSSSVMGNNLQPAAVPETSNVSRDLARILKASRSGKFPCPFPQCNKSFVNRLSCLNHFELHVVLPTHQFACSYCEKNYETPIQRHEHVGKAHSAKHSLQKSMDSRDQDVQYVKKQAWIQLEKWATINGGNQDIQEEDDYGGPPDLDCMLDQDQTPPPPILQEPWKQNDSPGGSQGGQAGEQPHSVSTGPSLQNIKAFYASKRLKISKRPTRFASQETLTIQRRIDKIRCRKYKRSVPADCELCENKHYTCQSSYIRHSRGIHWKWLPFGGLQCEFCDGKVFQDIVSSSDAELHYSKHSRQLRNNGTMFLAGYGKNRPPNSVHHEQLNGGRPHQSQMIDNATSGHNSDASIFKSKRSHVKDHIRLINRDYSNSKDQDQEKQCSWCTQSFGSFRDLQMHVEDNHKEFVDWFGITHQHQLEGLYPCFCCNNQYQLLTELQAHLKHDHPEQWEKARYYSFPKLRALSLQKERRSTSDQGAPPFQQRRKSTEPKLINRQLFGTGFRSDKMHQSTPDTVYKNSAQNDASPASPKDRAPSTFAPFGLLTPMSSSGSSSYGNFYQSPAYTNNGLSRNILTNSNFDPVLPQDENEVPTPTELPVISNAEAIKNTVTVFPTTEYAIPIIKLEPPEIMELPAVECQPPVQRFPCPYTHCGSSFSTEEKLGAHRRKHNLARKIVCTRCRKTVYTRGSCKYCSPCVTALRQEAESEAYKPKSWVMVTIQCFDCNATFDSEPNLVSHLKAEHMDPVNSKPRECPVCSFTLENAREFYSHTRAHAFDRDRPLSCKDPTKSCQQQFKNDQDLAKHLKAAHPDLDLAELSVAAEPLSGMDDELKPKRQRLHDKEPQKAVPKMGFFKPHRKLFKSKPVPIPASALAVAALPVLTVTTKQNENERVFPYPKNMCYICFCSFLDENILTTHVIYAHARTPTTYNCSDCNYRTANASAYQKHNVDHQKEYPHCCPQPRCFKKCRTLHGLKVHLSDHNAAEPMKLSSSLLHANGSSNEKVMLKSSDTQK